jgi:hypothetical protein
MAHPAGEEREIQVLPLKIGQQYRTMNISCGKTVFHAPKINIKNTGMAARGKTAYIRNIFTSNFIPVPPLNRTDAEVTIFALLIKALYLSKFNEQADCTQRGSYRLAAEHKPRVSRIHRAVPGLQ